MEITPELLPGEQQLSHFRSEWWESGIEFDNPEGRWDTGGHALAPDGVVGIEVRAAGHGLAIVPRVVTGVGFDPDELVTLRSRILPPHNTAYDKVLEGVVESLRLDEE